jgi:ABC-2 type transport system permease protein
VVRNFVELKARLTWNGIRTDTQRRFGFPVALILLTWLGIWLTRGYLTAVEGLRTTDPSAIPAVAAVMALILFLAWVTLPVIIFPLDENLDPQLLAGLPVTDEQMIRGLTAASLIAPATVVPLIVLGANLTVYPRGWWMAVPASLVFLVMLAVGMQLFSSAISAILRTRRGRDIATFLVLTIAGGSFALYRSATARVAEMGLAEAARSVPILDWSLLIPPVAAQKAIIDAASGSVLSAFLHLLAAVAGLLVMALAWKRLLNWMLTTPREGSRPAARARSRGMATGPWGVIPTLARKELRFYIRDPRQRLVWTGTVIFLGLAVAGTVMGAVGFIDFRTMAWAPLVAPVLVLFVGLPIALNLFGWERNAASYLFVLPLKPVQMLLGKNAAVALALVVETMVLAIALAVFTGQWQWFWLVIPLMFSAVGAQLAVGNIVSVMTPLRLPREGTDIFAQSTEQGCLAIVSQTVSFFVIGLLLVLPASVVVLTVDFGQVLPAWFAAGFAILWGFIPYLVSLWLSTKLLRRRLPEVMAWVQVN